MGSDPCRARGFVRLCPALHLWPAVSDGRLETREAAARAMRACLGIVGQRDGQLRPRDEAHPFYPFKKGDESFF